MLLPSGLGYRLRRDVGAAGRGLSNRSSLSGRSRRPTLLVGNDKVAAALVLGRACGSLDDSRGRPELPRRDADETLEAMAELALIREAGTRRDLCQGQAGSCLQQLLGSFDAAGDNVLVRGPTR